MDVSPGQPVLGNEYYRMTCLFVYQHEISNVLLQFVFSSNIL